MSRGGPIRPPSPHWVGGGGGGTAPVLNRTKIRGKNAVCLFDVCRAHRHLSIFYLKQKM